MERWSSQYTIATTYRLVAGSTPRDQAVCLLDWGQLVGNEREIVGYFHGCNGGAVIFVSDEPDNIHSVRRYNQKNSGHVPGKQRKIPKHWQLNSTAEPNIKLCEVGATRNRLSFPPPFICRRHVSDPRVVWRDHLRKREPFAFCFYTSRPYRASKCSCPFWQLSLNNTIYCHFRGIP